MKREGGRDTFGGKRSGGGGVKEKARERER